MHVRDFVVQLRAESMDLPVSVSETEFDLGVCTYKFMYQEQFSVSNSSNTAKVPYLYNFIFTTLSLQLYLYKSLPVGGVVQHSARDAVDGRHFPQDGICAGEELDANARQVRARQGHHGRA